jgi:hypothetical protein
MTEEDAVKKLMDCQENGDTEGAHVDADNVLCDLLDDLGYSSVVAEYRKVRKWFA